MDCQNCAKIALLSLLSHRCTLMCRRNWKLWLGTLRTDSRAYSTYSRMSGVIMQIMIGSEIVFQINICFAAFLSWCIQSISKRNGMYWDWIRELILESLKRVVTLYTFDWIRSLNWLILGFKIWVVFRYILERRFQLVHRPAKIFSNCRNASETWSFCC